MASPDNEHPWVDAQSLSDIDTCVYEAIATLESASRPVTRAAIAAAADLDDETVEATLRGLAERGVLVQTQSGGQAAFELGRRDWSAEGRRPGR